MAKRINDITTLDLALYADLKGAELKQKVLDDKLKTYHTWLFPQALAHYGNWKLIWKDGKVCPNATAKQNITSAWHFGLWKLMTQVNRSDMMSTQTKGECVSYSTLVPIILAGVKKYQNVPYSSWNITAGCPLIPAELLKAMLYTDYPDLGSNEILAIRQTGITDKNGKVKALTSAWKLYGIEDTELGGTDENDVEIPYLVATMVCQTWVAHPSIRSQYMILDPKSWDIMPKPLAEMHLIGNDLPWKDEETAPVYRAVIPRATSYKMDRPQVEEEEELPWKA